MTAVVTPAATDILPVVQGGTNKRLTSAQLLSLLRTYASLVFFGEATDEQVFGFFKAAHPVEVLGVQISAQEAPTGADLTLDLVNAGGVEQTKIGTLAAAASFQETIFPTALALAAGDVVKAKFKTVGSGVAGNGITVTLILKPNL